MSAGERFGNYELIAKLGEGGMGAVYRARDVSLGREAAIKFLLPQLSSHPELIERFKNEARAASQVDHPGVAHIYEYGIDPQRGAYIVMELLRGESLQERLDARGRLSIAASVRLVRQICSALRAAHAGGVVHRDLKPDNIFITPDPDVDGGERPKLLDFGIAKLMAPEARDRQQHKTTMPMGTPYYMSPEQCRADPTIDGRADLYAVGCILYQCVTGKYPIEGQNYLELIEAHKTRTPPPVSTHLPTCPPHLDALIQRMMAKRPEDRPTSAAEVYAELGRFLDLQEAAQPDAHAATQAPLSTRPAPSIQATQTVDPRTPARWPWAVGAVALIGGGAALMATQLGRGSDPKPAAPDARVAELDAAPTPEPVLVEPGWVRFVGVTTFSMGSTPGEIAAAMALCEKEAPAGACDRDFFEREAPLHEVQIGGFEIQEREVTNGAFAAWVGDDPGREIGDRCKVAIDADRPEYPVVVNWFAARAYCRSLGGDLPTEAQWELAARDTGRRIYPWGNEPVGCDDAVYGRVKGGPCAGREAAAQPAGAATGDRTTRGVLGLGGNVAEWVLDRFAPYAAAPPGAIDDPDQVVIRGGAFNDYTEGIRSAARKRADPTELIANVGFRCARPSPPGAPAP